MRYLIAIPCMDTMPTLFVSSLVLMDKMPETEIAFAVSSLIYDARNTIAASAVRNNFDRLMWLDSDMKFDRDMMKRMAQRMDEGYRFVTGVYCMRKPPYTPVVYKAFEPGIDPMPFSKGELDAGKGMIQIAGCGFGAVMMDVSILSEMKNQRSDYPFSPFLGLGEDLSFCKRATEMGVKLYCDTSIRLGHVGLQEFKL